jgi:hypothetical protein
LSSSSDRILVPGAPPPIRLRRRAPEQCCKCKDCRVRAGLVRGAALAWRLGRKGVFRAGLRPGWLGLLWVMTIRSRHAEDMPFANWPY